MAPPSVLLALLCVTGASAGFSIVSGGQYCTTTDGGACVTDGVGYYTNWDGAGHARCGAGHTRCCAGDARRGECRQRVRSLPASVGSLWEEGRSERGKGRGGQG